MLEALILSTALVTAPVNTAIIMQDQVPMLSAPKDDARQQAFLWSGELVEIRGTKKNYLHVYDYKRERPGYIAIDKVKTISLSEQQAPELLAALRYVSKQQGSESLTVGLAAAWLQAAPAKLINSEQGAEVFNLLGLKAQQLADNASKNTKLNAYAASRQTAYFDVLKGYGIKFNHYEQGETVQVCYDGEAFRRVLALPATEAQKADAALALTRSECIDPALSVTDKGIINQWQADILNKVDDTKLPAWQANQIKLRRASIWANVAYRRARLNTPAKEGSASVATEYAITSLAGVNKEELADNNLVDYNNAVMQVNASRWALLPKNQSPLAESGNHVYIKVTPKDTGESCVILLDAKHTEEKPLAQRCTFSQVWLSSVSRNRENTALAVAVQPTPNWRELWVFYKKGNSWQINILPPTSTTPGLGYAEFAGWIPGGKQLLVANEARAEGKYFPARYSVMNIDSLNVERQHYNPLELGAFKRWQDPSWKQQSVSIRE